MLTKKAHRVFSRVGVCGGIARVRPWASIYAAGFPAATDCGIKHHMPVGPFDGCTQSEGNVSTVSPIMMVLSTPSCSKRATVVSTQSSTPQHDWLPRPFDPAIQENSAPRCSVCPGWHQRISSRMPRHRVTSQLACRRAHFIFLIIFPLSFSAALCGGHGHCPNHGRTPARRRCRRPLSAYNAHLAVTCQSNNHAKTSGLGVLERQTSASAILLALASTTSQDHRRPLFWAVSTTSRGMV
jgi:hypothetical protein